MNIEAAFWDASALTPLFVDQATTASALYLNSLYSIAVWWGTAVEVHSALARLHRLGQLDKDGQKEALRLLTNLSQGWVEIRPDNRLRSEAQILLHKHPLRAADSLQLAAALAWCLGDSTGRTFLCADQRLSAAAANEGFSVIQP